MTVELVVFDVDGTLVDSQHMIVSCMTSAFTAGGHACPTDDAIRRIVGLPLEIGIAQLATHLSPIAVDALAEAYKGNFFKMRHQPGFNYALFPGTTEMLAELAKSEALLGIATGKTRRGLDALMDGFGWHGMFVTTQTGDIPPGKPAPDMLLRAIAEAGAEAANTLMIGDTTFDIEMAIAAKARPIGVPWGNHPAEELLAAGAELVLNDWRDLHALLGTTVTG
ncbi:HAD-IA family hydrolase [Lacibacterium aquatile]|uniref:HAD-IA family hydrolase n=1 Tax=Lacibacterium aquatile TaxID=1168082 RepID=A0ABW5DRG3_9PROT